MPKRILPTIATAPITALQPPPPPSPLVQRLRQDFRWAAISQFCWMFSDAFGLLDWDIENLEADFDGDETAYIPTLLVKLLFALTYNRQINRENVMEHTRKQYAKRSMLCPLGTVEEPVEWATLGLGQKVQILYELCELQMEDPARFRALLKSEDDAVSWRIDPVGWDKSGNTYFLFDDNRLWIQRLPPAPPPAPRPPKKSSLKAKRALKRQRQTAPDPSSSTSTPKPKSSHRKRPPPERDDDDYVGPDLAGSLTPPPAARSDEPISGPRRRTQVAFYGNPLSTVEALKRGGRSSLNTADETQGESSRSTRSTRAHPASGSAEVETPSRKGKSAAGKSNGDGMERVDHGTATNGSARKGKSAVTPGAPNTPSVSQSRSTRASRRSRGEGDEWQQIPDEWLQPSPSASAEPTSQGRRSGRGKANGHGDIAVEQLQDRKTRRSGRANGNARENKGQRIAEQDGDEDDSELSDLTDEEEHEARVRASGVAEVPETEKVGNKMDHDGADDEDEEEIGMDVDTDIKPETAVAADHAAGNDSVPQVGDQPMADDQADLTPVQEAEADDKVVDSMAVDPSPAEVIGNATPTQAEAPETAAATPLPLHDDKKDEDGEITGAELIAGKEATSEAVEVENVAKPLEEKVEDGQLQTDGVVADKPAERDEKVVAADDQIVQDAEEALPDEEGEETDEVKLAAKEANNLPDGFVEWEAVCVTLYDWRTWPEQFAKSRDPDEKALYQLLTEHVGPTVIEALVIKEQERLKQLAVANRKRSSRIATRELEREEQLRQEQAQREMEERMERSRAEEARKLREEADLIAREKAREERLREREERAQAREGAIIARFEQEREAKERAEKMREARYRNRQEGGAAEDSWELNCEVCRKTGWNVDGEEDIVVCEDCGRWQHMECHDRLDVSQGRRKRNWEKVDFRCKECLQRQVRHHAQRNGHSVMPSEFGTPQRPLGGPYHLVDGSLPGPSPPHDPTRPPPPPPKQGEYYLSYPPEGHRGPPAGYGAYYPPPPPPPGAAPAQGRRISSGQYPPPLPASATNESAAADVRRTSQSSISTGVLSPDPRYAALGAGPHAAPAHPGPPRHAGPPPPLAGPPHLASPSPLGSRPPTAQHPGYPAPTPSPYHQGHPYPPQPIAQYPVRPLSSPREAYPPQQGGPVHPHAHAQAAPLPSPHHAHAPHAHAAGPPPPHVQPSSYPPQPAHHFYSGRPPSSHPYSAAPQHGSHPPRPQEPFQGPTPGHYANGNGHRQGHGYDIPPPHPQGPYSNQTQPPYPPPHSHPHAQPAHGYQTSPRGYPASSPYPPHMPDRSPAHLQNHSPLPLRQSQSSNPPQHSGYPPQMSPVSQPRPQSQPQSQSQSHPHPDPPAHSPRQLQALPEGQK